MLIAYLDESYDQDQYFIGAAVADMSAWEQVEDGFAKLRALNNGLHGTSLTAEFHGHCIMGGRDDWKVLRGKHREAAALYESALRIARDAGVKYMLRGVDVARLNARYRYPEHPHKVVLGHLLERINEYCVQTAQADRCIVIADEVSGQEQYRRHFEEYQLIGTPGYRSSRLARIDAPIQFARSDLVDGLQTADLAVYLHRRMRVVQTANPRALKVQRRLWTLLRESIHHHGDWRP